MGQHFTEEEFKRIQAQLEASRGNRRELIALLEPLLPTLKIDYSSDTARTIEVKLALVKQLQDLHKDQEASVIQESKIQLLRDDGDNNQLAAKAMVVEALRSIKVSQGIPHSHLHPKLDNEKLDNLLEQEMNNRGALIGLEEIEPVSQSPLTPSTSTEK